jgi:intracellular septation protein A
LTTDEQQKQKQRQLYLNMFVNIIIPSVILIKFSGDEYLGKVYGLATALAFPIIYGLYDLYKSTKVNWFSIIGLISILFTGGISFFELDRTWMIIKETAIPLIMGIVVLASHFTKFPLVKKLLQEVIDMEKIREVLAQKGTVDRFEKKLNYSSYMMTSTFFVSAILNYALAEYVLIGQPGSKEFNESLGKMTALSFPVIMVPMMLMTAFIFYYLLHDITKDTELEWEQILKQ